MGDVLPKQYLGLRGRTVIEWALDRILGVEGLAGGVIALSDADRHWDRLEYRSPVALDRVTGGDERADSVLNALKHLAAKASRDDWVLVHDAARPCVRTSDIRSMIGRLKGDEVGGLLGVKIRDTVKRDNGGDRVEGTVDRTHLWRALTPQMFRLGLLLDSLQAALSSPSPVTDEASALELAGYRPRLLEGSEDNIKVTRPGDLDLAELYLAGQEGEGTA